MSETINRDDVISRADAIEAVDTEIRCTDKEDDVSGLTLALSLIFALPSADAVSMEEHVKELNDLAVEWKAKFAKAEKITDEIYDETMAKVAKECEECKERLRNIHPSAYAVEVVRCKDCKWYQGVHGVQGHAPCEWFNKQVLWNDFCSNGDPYKGGEDE